MKSYGPICIYSVTRRVTSLTANCCPAPPSAPQGRESGLGVSLGPTLCLPPALPQGRVLRDGLGTRGLCSLPLPSLPCPAPGSMDTPGCGEGHWGGHHRSTLGAHVAGHSWLCGFPISHQFGSPHIWMEAGMGTLLGACLPPRQGWPPVRPGPRADPGSFPHPAAGVPGGEAMSL